MREHKLTKWDIGQILIKAHDCLAECKVELLEVQPAMAQELGEMALDIGGMFNRWGSHSFGLPGRDDT